MCSANTIYKSAALVKLHQLRTLDLSKSLSSITRVSKNQKPTLLQRSFLNKNDTRSLIKNKLYTRAFYSTTVEKTVDSDTFERVCEETLDSLSDFFDEIVGNEPALESGDVVYGSGVLTIDLGKHGVYVINRQSPNRQIWLSSPTSGPKRYDYSIGEDCWIYKHDQETLHKLLKHEIEAILGKDLKISKCLHCRV